MKRLADFHLKEWGNRETRKPLLIRGARQIGKTFAVRKLGKSFKNIVEINLELAKDAHHIFEKNLDPERILNELQLYSGDKIVPGRTLLFIDEIQAVPQALIALRYFYEQMQGLHVIAAGSLLDFAIEEVGVPVGRISSLFMHPLSFMEFLAALGHDMLIEAILDHQEGEMPTTAHNKLLDLLGQYLAIGGMPEAVARWVKTKNPKESFEVHHDIIENYQMDFRKYAEKHQVKYLEQLYAQIPHLVGQQFQYKNVHGEYRKRELAPCLDLLCMANVVHRIYHTAAQGLPLGAGTNLEWFKLTFLDVAVCQAILGLDVSTWFLRPSATFVNRGMIAESFVGQELLCYSQIFKKPHIYFWRRNQKSSTAEVDYIHEHDGKVVPIEVKSGPTGKLKSLHIFLKEHRHVPVGLRFATNNYTQNDKILTRPLYDVVSLAHPDQKAALRKLIAD